MIRMKKKVLVDISLASIGMSGIPQDAKWLFKLFASHDNYETTGFIYNRFSNVTFASEESAVLHENGLNRDEIIARWLSYIVSGVQDYESSRKDHKFIMQAKKVFDAVRIDNKELFWNVIWRHFFSSGLTGKDKRFLEKRFENKSIDFIISNICNLAMFERLGHKKLQQPQVAAEYDFAIFEDSRPMQLSPGTKKIIRYHDSLPFTHLDTFSNPLISSSHHYKSVKECLKQGAFYVTNSEYTRKILVQLFPEAEKQSIKIPYVISDVYKVSWPEERSTIAEAAAVINSKQWHLSGKFVNYSTEDKFVLGVATIEPRKNWINYMKAFLIAKARSNNPNLKLVIAGAMGWKNDDIIAMIRSLVFQGHVIYLQDVHPVELKKLYEHCEVFMYPTLGEGFGLPPIEAQACGALVVSSDLEVHRKMQS